MNHWKRFQFFDKQIVKDEENKPAQFGDYKCVTTGRGHIISADNNGNILFLNQDFKPVQEFPAYKNNVFLIYQMKHSYKLVTVGDEAPNSQPIIKIFDLILKNKKGDPSCKKEIKIGLGKNVEIQPTHLTLLEDLTQIAIAFNDGSIIHLRGNLTSDRTINQRFIRNPSKDPINALIFHPKMHNVLFYVTDEEIYSVFIGDREYSHMILDQPGAKESCVSAYEKYGLMIGREDGIHFFTNDMKVASYGLFGQKSSILSHKDYAIIFSHEKSKYTINFYDLTNSFIAFSAPFPLDCKYILYEWGSFYVITTDNKIYQLTEKSLESKFETLFRKNLYDTAITLAHHHQYDANIIMDMVRQYGDHLYSKGDYDGAIERYIKTIGKLEPSYVIKLFLGGDDNRIRNLALYLQELHRQKQSNDEHTTLLLNCYVKLKDEKNLKAFLTQEGKPSFDIETAIRVLRHGKYSTYALQLAELYQEHASYLTIQIEDLKNHRGALDYIKTLNFKEAEESLKKYGKTLLSVIPQETTEFLMKLCTNYVPEKPKVIIKEKKPKAQSLENLQIENMTQEEQRSLLFEKPQPKKEDIQIISNQDILLERQPSARISSAAKEFIDLFVEKPEWLIKFLEFIIKEQPNSEELIYNTLLELYLRDDVIEAQDEIEKEKITKNLRNEALKLLSNPQSNFNEDHGLVLVKMYNFPEGITYMLEKKQLYFEILQSHMKNKNYENIIRSCQKYGNQEKSLWLHALNFFASCEDDCSREIRIILDSVERLNLLEPLLVIQILSRKKKIKFEIVRDFLTKIMSNFNIELKSDKQQIEQSERTREELKEELEVFRTQPFNIQKSICSECDGLLDLPSINFLCGHSFHLRCLTISESECPICSQNFSLALDRKKQLEQKGLNHEDFRKDLDSENGFSKIAEYFGKGLFSQSILEKK